MLNFDRLASVDATIVGLDIQINNLRLYYLRKPFDKN